MTTASLQYLTFRLDRELFAVDITKVKEVLELSTVTKVPRTADFMCGVINLRGHVVPVVDMRAKLGLSRTARTVDTCVVIAEVVADCERIVLGAMVDAVQEVIELVPSEIVPAPQLGKRAESGAIRGIGRRDDTFLIVLDIDKVFSSADVATLPEASTMAETASADLPLAV